MIGYLPTFTIGYKFNFVSSDIRVPNPPQRITTFILIN